MKIFIDVGHGGWDSGAVSGVFIEKDMNLKVALELRKFLQDNTTAEIMMSRETDVYVDLYERCKMANDWYADVFVSVHHNAGNGDGGEVIHSIYMGEGKKLADLVANEFKELGQNIRNVYARQGNNGDYYAVIRDTEMPAIITEFCFIDNVNDRQIADTYWELKDEADAIYKALDKMYGLVKPIPKHWAENDMKELMACGILTSDHSATLDEPASEAMVIAMINRLRKM